MTDDLRDLRDRLAGLCGWVAVKVCDGKWKRADGWRSGEPHFHDHPFPPNDLTALAAAWPEGWAIKIRLYSDGWYAYGRVLDCSLGWKYDACQCDTEYEARLRLTVAVLEAEQ